MPFAVMREKCFPSISSTVIDFTFFTFHLPWNWTDIMQTPAYDCDNEAFKEGSLGSRKEAKADQPQVAFPEGGLRAWSVVAGAFCISFCTFGYLNAYG
jgi:hypothetical protein